MSFLDLARPSAAYSGAENRENRAIKKHADFCGDCCWPCHGEFRAERSPFSRCPRRLGLRRTVEVAEEGKPAAQSTGRRSGRGGCGSQSIRSALRRVSWRNGRRWPERAQFARRSGSAGDSRDSFLDSYQRSRSSRHAGLVEASRAAAVATCQLPHVSQSFWNPFPMRASDSCDLRPAACIKQRWYDNRLPLSLGSIYTDRRDRHDSSLFLRAWSVRRQRDATTRRKYGR